jgi:hypothetical protein
VTLAKPGDSFGAERIKTAEQEWKTEARKKFERALPLTKHQSTIRNQLDTWWRREESEYSYSLKTRKLLKNKNAENAQTSKIGTNWNVSGTWDFHPSRNIT